MDWIKRYWVAVLLVIAVSFGSYTQTQGARASAKAAQTAVVVARSGSVKVCNAENAAQGELLGFLTDAAKARRISATDEPAVLARSDLKTARSYEARAAKVKASIVNCETTYPVVPAP